MRTAGNSLESRIFTVLSRVAWTLAVCILVLETTGCGLLAKYRPYVEEDEREFLPPGFEHPAARLERLENAVASKPSDAEKRQIAAEIAQFFQESDDPAIREDLTKLAAKLIGPETLRVLQTATRDPDPRVRLAAAKALGEVPEPNATALLLNLLETDPNTDVRQAAIVSLGKRNDAAALPALGDQLKNRDPATQYLAMKSLREITGENFGYDARQWLAYIENTAQNTGEMMAARPSAPTR
ncbi:MAG: HEAT repeat domain-containing protein [Planctomycetota bacterium]|nr:MAG: HEAT repeat domain-containing protein [Planctomycetota bacterium]